MARVRTCSAVREQKGNKQERPVTTEGKKSASFNIKGHVRLRKQHGEVGGGRKEDNWYVKINFFVEIYVIFEIICWVDCRAPRGFPIMADTHVVG